MGNGAMPNGTSNRAHPRLYPVTYCKWLKALAFPRRQLIMQPLSHINACSGAGSGRRTMGEGVAVAMKALGAVPGFAKFVEPRIEHYRLARVARDLGRHKFWSDGMRGPLTRIADGKAGPEVVADLAARLEATEPKVKRLVTRLRAARDGLVSVDLGMGVANHLDELIYRKVGPGAIRDSLFALVKSKKSRAEKARLVLRRIDDFNLFLDRVHESIRPKRGKPASTPAKHRGRA